MNSLLSHLYTLKLNNDKLDKVSYACYDNECHILAKDLTVLTIAVPEQEIQLAISYAKSVVFASALIPIVSCTDKLVIFEHNGKYKVFAYDRLVYGYTYTELEAFKLAFLSYRQME